MAVLAGAQRGRADSRQADRLFAKGRELLAAGEVAEACAAFERSQALEAAVPTLLNLGNCREKAGQLATARAHFVEAARLTREATDARGKALHGAASAHAARLEPLVSSLTLRVAEQRAGVALELLRDGQVVPSEQWNQAAPVDGGTYAIVARAPGAVEWTASVSVGAQADRQVVEVPALAEPPSATETSGPVATRAPVAAPAPVPPPSAAPAAQGAAAPRSSPMLRDERALAGAALRAPSERPGLLWPVAVGSAALVLGGSAAGVSWWASSTYLDAKAERQDQARRDALEHSAIQRRYLAQGLAAASVVGAGVAIWLFLRQPSERPHGADRADRAARAARAARSGQAARGRAPRLWLAPSAGGLVAAGWF